MANTIHRNLTGSDLHEPKGTDTALAGQVYVSNGSGSGAWTTASSVITNTAFTTGDLKHTHKTTADTSWILWSDGTIGDSSSGASIRANADTSALFTLYWNNYSNTVCPVSGGRGASATADYAAHKTIALPLGAGRVLGIVGTGAGLTARTLGQTLGEENHTLISNELPNITPTFTGINDTISVTSTVSVQGAAATLGGGSVAYTSGTVYLNSTGNFTPRGSISGFGGNIPHNTMQPTAFVNVMIKL